MFIAPCEWGYDCFYTPVAPLGLYTSKIQIILKLTHKGWKSGLETRSMPHAHAALIHSYKKEKRRNQDK